MKRLIEIFIDRRIVLREKLSFERANAFGSPILSVCNIPVVYWEITREMDAIIIPMVARSWPIDYRKYTGLSYRYTDINLLTPYNKTSLKKA